MENRKWLFSSVVLVKGQSYSIGAYRFVPGRPLKIQDPRIMAVVRGNPAFSIEDHFGNEAGTPAPAPAPVAAAPAPAPEPPSVAPAPAPVAAPGDSLPAFTPAAGVPIGAFVVTTESKPSGKKVLKKQTRIEGR